jgi:hypothetical protein
MIASTPVKILNIHVDLLTKPPDALYTEPLKKLVMQKKTDRFNENQMVPLK